MSIRNFIISLIATTFFCFGVRAQEKDPLFDKGYVTDILKDKGNTSEPTPTPKPKGDKEAQDEARKDSSDEAFPEVGPKDPTPTTQPIAAKDEWLTDTEGGIEISSIGAVLSAKDAAHYEKSLNQLIDVAIDANVRLDTIYSMGTIEEVFVPVAAQMKADETGRRYFEVADKIQLSEKIPAPYDTMIKRSPTWIISTPNGKYILEALEPLKKFVSRQGKLVRVDEMMEVGK